MKRSFVVDRTKWARGGRGGNSRMLNSDGNMCCLGFIADQLGHGPLMRKKASEGVYFDMPYEVVRASGCGSSGFLTEMGLWGPRSTALAKAAADINDDDGISDDNRERQLIALFRRHGVRLRFIN